MDHPAARTILDLYQRHAEAFYQQRSRTLFEQRWLDKLLAAMGSAGRILDLGCGNRLAVAAAKVEHSPSTPHRRQQFIQPALLKQRP